MKGHALSVFLLSIFVPLVYWRRRSWTVLCYETEGDHRTFFSHLFTQSMFEKMLFRIRSSIQKHERCAIDIIIQEHPVFLPCFFYWYYPHFAESFLSPHLISPSMRLKTTKVRVFVCQPIRWRRRKRRRLLFCLSALSCLVSSREFSCQENLTGRKETFFQASCIFYPCPLGRHIACNASQSRSRVTRHLVRNHEIVTCHVRWKERGRKKHHVSDPNRNGEISWLPWDFSLVFSSWLIKMSLAGEEITYHSFPLQSLTPLVHSHIWCFSQTDFVHCSSYFPAGESVNVCEQFISRNALKADITQPFFHSLPSFQTYTHHSLSQFPLKMFFQTTLEKR